MLKKVISSSLCLLFGLMPLMGLASGDVRMPHGLDLSRLNRVDVDYAKGVIKGSDRLKVFAVMTSIDDKEADFLFPKKVGLGMGTPAQLKQRFKTTISSTNRFDFHDERQTDVLEGYVVEAKITQALQTLENFRAFHKSVTTVRMSVELKDLETGQTVRSRNIDASYGVEDGDGTIVNNLAGLKMVGPGVCVDQAVCKNLEADYDRALQLLFDQLVEFVATTLPPIAKVIDVEGDEVTMLGGLAKGFHEKDDVIIFRAKKLTNEQGIPLPPAIRAIAKAQCSVGDHLTCTVVQRGKFGDVAKGDYAVPIFRNN